MDERFIRLERPSDSRSNHGYVKIDETFHSSAILNAFCVHQKFPSAPAHAHVSLVRTLSAQTGAILNKVSSKALPWSLKHLFEGFHVYPNEKNPTSVSCLLHLLPFPPARFHTSKSVLCHERNPYSCQSCSRAQHPTIYNDLFTLSLRSHQVPQVLQLYQNTERQGHVRCASRPVHLSNPHHRQTMFCLWPEAILKQFHVHWETSKRKTYKDLPDVLSYFSSNIQNPPSSPKDLLTYAYSYSWSSQLTVFTQTSKSPSTFATRNIQVV